MSGSIVMLRRGTEIKVLSWDAFNGSRCLKNTSVAMTIGVFDGIHRGHQSLIQKVVEKKHSEPVVLTFRFNPRLFLKPHLFPGDITSLHQKMEILAKLGIKTVILIDFSNDFSKLSGNDFLMAIRGSCDLSYLVLGDNFRCGYQGKTSAYDVRKIMETYHTPVEIAPPVTWKGATLSSTRIRAALREGQIREAAEMMGRNYILDIATTPQTNEDSYRTIEKMGLHQVVPPPGTYLAHVKTPTHTVPIEVEVTPECIRWQQQNREEAVSIEFNDIIGKGERNHVAY